MSFLVVSGNLLARLGDFDLPAGLAPLNNERAGLSATVRGVGFTLYSTDIHAVGEASVSFSGYAFARGRLFHGRAALATVAGLVDAIDEAEGVFVLVTAGKNAATLGVRPDVLGQFPVFYWRAAGDFIISDNAEMIAVLLRRLAIGGDADPLQVALNVTYGSAFGSSTSFRGVSILSARHEIAWDQPGGFRLREIVSRHALMRGEHETYDGAIRTITDRLAARCRTIAEAIDPNWNTVVDLSGGVNSRMTFAGLLKSGAAPRFSYFSYGGFPARPDRHVCDMLLDRYRLKAGTLIRGNTASAYSPAATIAHGAGRYFGLKPTNFADFGTVEIADYCRLTGYCGEHTKAWGVPLQNSMMERKSAATVASRQMAACNTAESMLTGEGLARVHQAFTHYFDELTQDVGSSLLNHFTYIENRSRFHFGLASAVANKVRVSLDPLIDREVVSAARHLSHWQQKSNRLAYDIILTLGGEELAQHPFAEFVWNKGIGIEGYDAYAARALSVTEATLAQCAEAPGMRVVDVRPKSGATEIDFDGSAFAAAPPAKNPSSRSLTERRMLLYFAEAIPASDAVWDLVDRDSMVSAAQADAQPTALKEANIGRLAAGLAYHSGAGRAAPLTSTVRARALVDGV